MRRFNVRGVFWRQFLRWACLTIPLWAEGLAIGISCAFFLLWGPGRRGVMENLSRILPGSSALANLFRTYRVFWNFAWTIADTMRFRELRAVPDWEFAGYEHFNALLHEPGGAIMLTAHMGSYDLGAHLFTETTRRSVLMVRAPEIDPDTRRFEEKLHDDTTGDALRVDFNTKTSELAFELLDAVRSGEIVAIQGDRVTPGIASVTTKLFGVETELPAGPFALAMAGRVPIYPVFVTRTGRRRYRMITFKPIRLERRSRHRDDDIQRAVDEWASDLQGIIASGWQQWFAFEPFAKRSQP
jgi:lauroyl/myristoyl acyltransferase